MTTETAAATDAEIQRLEQLRYEAVTNQDFESFNELCHADLIYTHSNGERDSLRSYLDKCRSGHYVYHRIDHPIEDIVVVGDVALVIGEMNADITVAGKPKRLENTSIAVWVREGGAWKFLAYQPTPKPVSESKNK